jgi:hypothetical protein
MSFFASGPTDVHLDQILIKNVDISRHAFVNLLGPILEKAIFQLNLLILLIPCLGLVRQHEIDTFVDDNRIPNFYGKVRWREDKVPFIYFFFNQVHFNYRQGFYFSEKNIYNWFVSF